MDRSVDCDAARGLMAEFAGGELGDAARAGLESHLRVCESCRTELAGLMEAGAVIARAAGSEADARAATAGLRAPVAAPAARSAWGRLSVAAGLLLAFGAGYAWRGPASASPLPVREAETVVSSFARLTSDAPHVPALGRAMLSMAQR